MTGTHDGEQAPEGVLLALADPIRRQILSTLVGEGGATSTSLAAALPVTT
ncbi:helix-turn-helix domain-containing protein [Streptomyces guryensis]|uniref:Helix-turn-helix domain-containing protein n=1 Tax=Streptomyces guryensis TaxID=2886947 RepID=A0A9Q3VXG3_9ACTN|nr:helix-turn-helix domain-containing protein [Streptomyces guryensis]MCD9879937.1 helix-turn-helix domain-containing protein [Streptomyces guryensis]